MQQQVSTADLRNLGKTLQVHEKEFLDILCHISTYKAAKFEFDHSVETLLGVKEELIGLESCNIKSVAAYLPPNVILFSYILYVVVPSAISHRVLFRPSVRSRDVTWAIHEKILQLIELPVKISLDSRNVFWRDSASSADLIIFTGKCANAADIQSQVSANQLFLYFGSGVNPFIVGPASNISKAARDAVDIRIYNSGQDCLCPDLFLLHKEVCSEFVSELVSNLERLKYGDKRDPSSDYSNLVYPDVAEFILEFLEQRKQFIKYGGTVDVLERYVQPTVLVQDISSIDTLPEFFAPIFNIVIYSDNSQITQLIASDLYKPKSMGAMLYGADDLIPAFSELHTVTTNETLFEINKGNLPFGGRGECASYWQYKNKKVAEPLLISQVVKKIWVSN